jgi:hypothetical protein
MRTASSTAGMGRRVALASALAAALVGCASPGQKQRAAATAGPAEAAPAPAAIGITVPPEKFEEIDNFFRGKASQLQFTCYNPEVERTRKKYQGFVSLLVMVAPGGKAQEVKIINSSLGAPGIEECILSQARAWEWPDVPAQVPYNGTLGFKPAW